MIHRFMASMPEGLQSHADRKVSFNEVAAEH
jgi:hypothetical protein